MVLNLFGIFWSQSYVSMKVWYASPKPSFEINHKLKISFADLHGSKEFFTVNSNFLKLFISPCSYWTPWRQESISPSLTEKHYPPFRKHIFFIHFFHRMVNRFLYCRKIIWLTHNCFWISQFNTSIQRPWVLGKWKDKWKDKRNNAS